MPLFLIITKLLLLKILIALAYDYGYNPSAEEFDNLLVKTRHLWTGKLLAKDRHRSWYGPVNERRSDSFMGPYMENRYGEVYVPKYNYGGREKFDYETDLNLKWPGSLQRRQRPRPNPYENSFEQTQVASSPIAVHVAAPPKQPQQLPPPLPSKILSTLDFKMFSDENESSESNFADISSRPLVVESPTNNSESVFNKNFISSTDRPNLTNKKPQGTIIQIADSNESQERSHELFKNSQFPQKYSLNNIYQNNSEAHFPIFFTNPVTGIVYAITEIGRTDQNLTKLNPQQQQQRKYNQTIPIYITKEQYDRDIYQLKQDYEKQCATTTLKPNRSTIKQNSALSGAPATTQRPQIIRLKKPTNSKRPLISKLPTGKLTVKKPPPVMVQAGVSVSDQVQLPMPPKKKQSLKRKTKKRKQKKRPGRKNVNLAQQTHQGAGPQIIMGTQVKGTTTTTTPATLTLQPARPTQQPTTQPPIITKQHFTAQLERPNLPTTLTTIFSQRPIAATKGYMVPKTQIFQQKIKLNNPYASQRFKRSLTIEKSAETLMPMTKTASDELVSMRRINARKKDLPKLSRNITRLGVGHLGNNTLGFRRKKIVKTTRKPTATSTASPKDRTATTTQRNLSATQVNQTLSKTNAQKSRKSTKRNKADDDDGFDFFDLLEDDDDEAKKKDISNDEDDEDDEDEDDEDEDDDDDDDSDYYYSNDKKGVNVTKKPKRHVIYINHNNESAEDHSSNNDESNDELKEQITHDNSSSAEDSADYGALEDSGSPSIITSPQATGLLDGEDFSTVSKNTNAKKRIRRRPVDSSTSSSSSDEDYNERDDGTDNDDDDDDGGGGGGVGDFFRMVFYPVEMVMTRVFDGFAGSDEDSDDKPNFPTYTQYSSVNRIDANVEDDETQANSLSSWFGYLFGFNRRTKKIGSTTIAPPATPANVEPTEAPGWFESWFGGSKTTTSAEKPTSAEDYDDYDKWFSSWFSDKPKSKRRRATTTTTTTTATIPQVPILTIVDPMKNPQNWLGILAHHIINSTTTTTQNPILQAITRGTTTASPDIPRFVSYDKYQIWRLKPQDVAQVKALIDYKKSEEGVKLQWLKGPSMRGLTDVLVPPKMFVDFQGALQFESIAHEILIFDVGKAIAYEQNKEQFLLAAATKPPHKQKYAPLINMSWNKYHAYDDIVKYLESVRMRHPQIVELFHIGRSYEGRPLIVVKLEMKHGIGSGQSGGSTSYNHKKLRHKKKSGHASAVFIEAGTHGLEWIGPATATWMINEVLRLMKSNKTSPQIEAVKNTTWYILPVLNPDGYAYSHEYDRFWRKSRSRHISLPNGILDSAMEWFRAKRATEKVCYGVDLDRNWHYQWGKRGSSKAPCNEQFAGPTPFSEPETKALSEFLMDNRKQIKLYLSMQAYGQIISYPKKANVTFDSERVEDFMDVAMVGTDGLRKNGSKSRYKIDSSNDLIEHRAGCSDAFAAYEVGTPFSYTLYLADNGVHGYLLPSSSIEPTARDAFEIVTAMLDYI